MRGSIKLFTVFGISINIHSTFFLLLLLVLPGGIKWVFLVIGVFFFVTMHEICHSLAAKRFGIKVREITLLPIGGIAAMSKMPEKPSQELLISLAGPLSNIVIVIVFFYPLKLLLGEDVLFHPLSARTWPLTVAYIYWLNLMLAAFNMIPAFPMDGGRVLRSILANWLGYQKATKIAVNFGHVFALAFAYFGIIRFNIILVVIAIFIYMAASNEELQVDVKETLKKFKVRDILPRDFYTCKSDTTLGKVLELVYHSHQEDFPVVDEGKMVGFVTRQDIMAAMHRFGADKAVGEIMAKDFPMAKDTDSLIKIQNIMHEKSARALPVMKEGKAVGVVTIEDIGRIYAMASQKNP
ncbi:MAG: site-2 protease family protein [Candidatus Omnitrophota bacterium]